MSNIKFQFYQKSEKNKNKPALIYVFFTLDKRYKLSLNVHVEPRWWDKKLHRAIVIETQQQKQADTRNSKRVNRFLDHLQKELTELFDRYKDWDKVQPNPICLSMQTQIVNNVKEFVEASSILVVYLFNSSSQSVIEGDDALYLIEAVLGNGLLCTE